MIRSLTCTFTCLHAQTQKPEDSHHTCWQLNWLLVCAVPSSFGLVCCKSQRKQVLWTETMSYGSIWQIREGTPPLCPSITIHKHTVQVRGAKCPACCGDCRMTLRGAGQCQTERTYGIKGERGYKWENTHFFMVGKIVAFPL